MDKNTVTGFLLIILVIIGFSWYSRPSQEELQQMAKQDSIAAVEMRKAELKSQEEEIQVEKERIEQATDSSALFFSQRSGSGQDVVFGENLKKIR